jgi:vacuolar-type H+-ATPase subunit E/Vma4
MSLASILARIQAEADSQAETVLCRAQEQAEQLVASARREAEQLYNQNMDREKKLLEQKKQRLLVGRRLENRKGILGRKQEILDGLFDELEAALKKKRIQKLVISPLASATKPETVEFFIADLRRDSESEVAVILFS